MISFLNLASVRNRKSEIANRQFATRHARRPGAGVGFALGFAAGCALLFIVITVLKLLIAP